MKLLTMITLSTLSMAMTGCTGLGRAIPLTVQWKAPSKVKELELSDEVAVEPVNVEDKIQELNVDIQDPQVREALKEMLAGASTPQNASASSVVPEESTNTIQATTQARHEDDAAEAKGIPDPPQSSQRRSLQAVAPLSAPPPNPHPGKQACQVEVANFLPAPDSETVETEVQNKRAATANPAATPAPEPSGVAQANHASPSVPNPDSPSEEAEALPAKGAWKSQLGELIGALEEQLSLRQDSLTEGESDHLETVLSLLYLLANDRDSALERLDFTEPEKEAFWKELVFAVSVILEPEELDVEAPFFVGDHRRASLALAHLRKAEEGLSPLASLQVNNITLCEEVKGFGNYVAFPSASFEPGQATIVYCEIENYKTTQVAGPRGLGPQFESEFQSSISIVNEDRQVVRQFTYQPIVDTARNRRRDFYIHYTLTIPDDLPKGSYSISLQVEDVKAGKTTQSPPVPFRVR